MPKTVRPLVGAGVAEQIERSPLALGWPGVGPREGVDRCHSERGEQPALGSPEVVLSLRQRSRALQGERI